MREAREETDEPTQSLGIVPTGYATQGPRKVPRVDYERIFVLDAAGEMLGEYVLNDDCPLEFADLKRSVPINGLRHLVPFYQGEYSFTPFKVDDLWFVLLARGIPRIEERGHLGTVLAAARIHIPTALEPTLAKREAELRERELAVAANEADLVKREDQLAELDADLQLSSMKLHELEAEIRVREARLQTLRDYAVQMQESFVKAKETSPKADKPEEPRPAREVEVRQ